MAQTTDDGEDSVDNASTALGVAFTNDEGDDDDGIEITDNAPELTTRGSTTTVAPVRIDGAAYMGEPIPVPWNPPLNPGPNDSNGTSKNR
ncbi:Hypothetical protein A7982_00797 [Minicystis rosea]|nr:Hypothetical protein A7982_00797 [Minicystis rosea]